MVFIWGIFALAQKLQKWVVLYSSLKIYISRKEYNLTQKLSFEKARSSLTKPEIYGIIK